jgi:8-oxo-dGTP diphosphatase
MIEVVAGLLIDHENKKFLIQERPAGTSAAGLWEFPAGKIEPGETEAEALRREWLEELAMRIELKDKLDSSYFEIDDAGIFRIALYSVTSDDDPHPQEGQQIRGYGSRNSQATMCSKYV